jgi:cell division inhibitor SepF
MGLFDELKKLTKPYDDEDDDDFEEEDFNPRASERIPIPQVQTPPQARSQYQAAGRSAMAATARSVFEPEEKPEKKNKVVNIHATTQLQVILVKPERFENAAEIADHLREKRTVVLNLESTNKDMARRLLDFLSGVTYAQDGKIKKVAVSTYIITPYNVDIMGDLIDELENNGMYF